MGNKEKQSLVGLTPGSSFNIGFKAAFLLCLAFVQKGENLLFYHPPPKKKVKFCCLRCKTCLWLATSALRSVFTNVHFKIVSSNFWAVYKWRHSRRGVLIKQLKILYGIGGREEVMALLESRYSNYLNTMNFLIPIQFSKQSFFWHFN